MELFYKFAENLLEKVDFNELETYSLNINEKNYFYFTLFIKTVLDANNNLKKDMIKEIENLLNSQIKEKVISIINKINKQEDKELIDLDNLIEEYRENIDELEFKLKIQKIINPDLNKLDIYYVGKDNKKKEEYIKKYIEKHPEGNIEQNENIELEKLLNDKYKDTINEIYTLIKENNKKIKEITNEIEENEMTNKYNDEKSINEIINNKNQQFELLNKIKAFINKLNLSKLFEQVGIKDVNPKLEYYIDYYDFLKNIVPIKKEKLLSKEKIIMEELVDYHGKYRHAIKELFIFDRIWSKQNLFFKDKLADIKQSTLKYKHINYYTNNYQRPIIYPDLDYRNKYPEFSKYKYKNTEDNKDNIDNNLFNKIEEKDKDNYCFDFVSTQLDKIIEKNDNLFFSKYTTNPSLIFFKACLIKREYHVKGILFIVNENLVVFYSHLFKDQDNKKYVCNFYKNEEGKVKGKCLGSLFPCLKKEENRKIQFNISNLRMILKRIYYYRRTGIEFFTKTKSYLFNIGENNSNDKNVIFDTVSSIFDPIIPIIDPINEKYENFFKLRLNLEQIIGYIKLEDDLFPFDKKKKKDYSKISGSDKIQNTVELYYRIISENYSTFKLIMLINLISNRSFNDMNQYPVFPLLYFPITKEKGEIDKIDRTLREHIGFNSQISDFSKERANKIKENKKSYDEDKEKDEDSFYFNTNYSNFDLLQDF